MTKKEQKDLKEYKDLIEKLGYASYSDEIPENVTIYDPHKTDKQ